MSVYRKKGSLVYTMDFQFQGQHIKESTGVRTKTLALRIERNRRTALEEGRAGVSKPKAVQLFAAVAEEYLETERAALSPDEKRGHASTVRIDEYNLKHLLPHFGKKLLCDVTPKDVAEYQQKRLQAKAAPKTINLELGTFRSIISESGHWARLLPKIRMMEVSKDIGRCLPPKEIEALLQACIESQSRLLYPMVLLQLETGSRSGTVKSLPWAEVDFEGCGLRWGRDKTKAGTNRTIPISQKAMAVLEMWAENFHKRKPNHFVFPSETYRQAKNGGESVPPMICITDPTKPVTSLQRSWETALENAAWILAGRPTSKVGIPPLQCRFHDLRHTACTRMIQSGIPIPVIAQLVGWSATTMWEMAQRYGHFSQNELRKAVETITGGESPLKSPPLASFRTAHLS